MQEKAYDLSERLFLQIVCLVMTLNKSYIFLPDSSSRSERWAEELLTGTEQLWCRYPALPTRVAHSPAGWRGVKLKEKQTQEPLTSPAIFLLPVHFLYIKKRATLQLEKTPGYFLIIFIIFFFNEHSPIFFWVETGKTSYKILPHLFWDMQSSSPVPCLLLPAEGWWDRGVGNWVF